MFFNSVFGWRSMEKCVGGRVMGCSINIFLRRGRGLRGFGRLRYPSKPAVSNSPNWGNLERRGRGSTY